MAVSPSGRTWEEASSPAALRLARRFEADWRRSRSDRPSRASDVLTSYLAEADGIPGGRLALLRAEMGLRWEAGERPTAAEYLGPPPWLSAESVVALLYEEFCLREEAGERPEPGEYLTNYPEYAAALRRVLDIHNLVGSGTSTAFVAPSSSAAGFPRAGETIAGFRLVEELGRGAFARVFLAEERQLADRPVALKVARTGSREPQALARLQHTHIVPVHSYRTDPATGLHLLCMPYFGRVTLASLLADPGAKVARGGADLLEVLDRLGANDPAPSGRAAVRASLTPKSHAQAIAWWCARMAEALHHAHGVGLLHRDVKPSNVLLTRDGLPMLLDFNLAREAVIDADDPEAAVPGGTLDYMAPEQLDELSDGFSERADPRSDVYGLGVLLYEALAGSRPFPSLRGAGPVTDLLARAADQRRGGPPRLRESRPEVPSALEAVVVRCLAPEPADRYATAADLATDLQAVADDRALRFAREPVADRTYRWARRNRRAIATAVPLLVAVALIAALVLRDRFERSRIRAQVADHFEAGIASEEKGNYQEAAVRFETAARLAELPKLGGFPEQVAALRSRVAAPKGFGLREDASLDDLRSMARRRSMLAKWTGRVRADAVEVFTAAETLRFRLTGLGGDPGDATRTLADVLTPFFVFDAPKWFERPDLTLLDDPGRARLFAEVNELLFLQALSYDAAAEREAAESGRSPSETEAPRALLREARSLCDRAIEFASPRGPWQALRARLAGLESGEPVDDQGPTPDEPTALGCFQWGALALRQGRREEATARFRDAVRIEPGNYWYQYYLAFAYDHPAGSPAEALRHYDIALALKPTSPWVRFSRGRLHRAGGHWAAADDDLRRALGDFRALPGSLRPPAFEAQVRLELGLVRQSLADADGARREYDRVIATDPSGSYARAARLNLAKLEADSGDVADARSAYDELLRDRPEDRQARLARGLLALRNGDPADAEGDFSALIEGAFNESSLAELLRFRALARLAQGRPGDALDDADRASDLGPGPGTDRLRTRALLALGLNERLHLDDPDAIGALPLQGPSLVEDLRRLADDGPGAVEPTGASPTGPGIVGRLNRAVALAHLGRHRAAREEARLAVALAPLNTRARLILARILARGGRQDDARKEVERAIEADPENPAAWVLRGRLAARAGEPGRGLADLDRAITLGADGGALRSARAEASTALGLDREAVREWTRALEYDPEDPVAFLGRARAFLRIGRAEQAVADLEQAVAWSAGRPSLALPIGLAYARCLPDRPMLFGRLVSLVRAAWSREP